MWFKWFGMMGRCDYGLGLWCSFGYGIIKLFRIVVNKYLSNEEDR